MIFKDSKKFWNKLVENYLTRDGYLMENDLDITYQEVMLVSNFYRLINRTEHDLNSDYFLGAFLEWEGCVAHFFKPMVIDKPWDEVFVDKTGVKNATFDGNIYVDYWTRVSPYKEMKEKEDEERQKSLEADILRRQKQRDYQRQRRAKIKAEKEKNKK